ncbi:hypothetical protein [Borborobacter arsenicus]|uniref:hypothetical protein n=1 Tax=Borborobacter arsenicus TaxID=1851146 RepID=UPI0014054FC5|nr:hypothetical protein [Pseudaminobacter arsenicus]
MTDWPKRADGTNKTIGEMTEEERRPILRAAFLRSKMAAVPALAYRIVKEPTT